MIKIKKITLLFIRVSSNSVGFGYLLIYFKICLKYFLIIRLLIPYFKNLNLTILFKFLKYLKMYNLTDYQFN